MTTGASSSSTSRRSTAYAARQFATLKSALLAAQPSARPAARRDVSGAARRVVHRAEGLHLRRHRPQRLGQEHGAQVVAGITKPTSGTVRVDGRISALIELGAGFHPEISGRENIFINGIMLGL